MRVGLRTSAHIPALIPTLNCNPSAHINIPVSNTSIIKSAASSVIGAGEPTHTTASASSDSDSNIIHSSFSIYC
ncbi:hypothetical protein P8452_25881 [Trifolium repens]|nr:hypothetical protein P8452_25881 [Trifolium repens]